MELARLAARLHAQCLHEQPALYPLTTVMLARAFLGEQLGAPRLAGVVAVLGGVGLISVSA